MSTFLKFLRFLILAAIGVVSIIERQNESVLGDRIIGLAVLGKFLYSSALVPVPQVEGKKITGLYPF